MLLDQWCAGQRSVSDIRNKIRRISSTAAAPRRFADLLPVEALERSSVPQTLMKQRAAVGASSGQLTSAIKLHNSGCHHSLVFGRVRCSLATRSPAERVSRHSIHRASQRSRTSRLQCAESADVAGQFNDQQWQWKLSILRRMLAFMGPALVIPLGDPLMSLTDTVFIGQCAGTGELAAMGPANIVFSFSQYIFQALQIAAISLISDDLRKGFTQRAEHTLRVSVSLALMSGFVVMGIMEVAADQLMAGTGADPSLVPLAASYMRIRALAQPAVLVTMVCQAGLLAQQNSRLPALAVVVTVAVNIMSNLIAVGWLGLGLQGAAATTVATQVVGASVLLQVSQRGTGLTPNLTTLPSLDDIKLFARTMGPLSVTYVCKNLCYILLQTAAASLSLVQLAAHQAVFSVWNLLAFTTAPLEQVALAYVPTATAPWQQRSTIQIILAMSAVIGVTCGCLAAGVPLLIPHALTKDPAVWEYMGRVAPSALVAMSLTAADVGVTGILLAKRDLAYVARAYSITLCLLGVFVWFGVIKGGWGLEGVWAGLVFFFGLRCLQSIGRLITMGDGKTSSRPGSTASGDA